MIYWVLFFMILSVGLITGPEAFNRDLTGIWGTVETVGWVMLGVSLFTFFFV